ncbi:endonuclease MutS2 [Candidatus Enterococcus huntleyi]|uniref:endonuclease MutS2 n=1 Tax=Candidatus Enterococcus huntleyi TaxID=1857217 RepID=UPI00137B3386|nr:endonuclease MutS2 [Enterococcus sp. JM4C]
MINQETINKLQFNQIIREVQVRAIGDYSKQRIEQMGVQTSLTAVESRQQETKEARLIIESGQHVPFMGLVQINRLLKEVQKGLLLTPGELIEVADFLRSNRMIQKFFEKNQYQTPLLYTYSKNLSEFLAIEENIYQKIQGQRILDDASKSLRRIRKQLNECEREIEEKLMKFLRHPNNKTMLQESMIVKKGDHFTIPIKASYKNKVPGSIIEQSGKGQTAFIEPAGVAKLNEQIASLKAEEVAEEYQILAELNGLLSEQELEISNGIEAVTTFDIIFARAKYSREVAGITPLVNKEERIHLKGGKHPLLPSDAVPLDFQLGSQYRGLVITGANAGGKTLVLKTVGLLTLMTMFGLQIPAKEGTEIAILDQLFVDIGDQQNLENALSTFSGHMKNVAEILKQAGRHSLVLLDEIGSGTEPNEGAGLAIAIMESLYQKGALVVATTHYGEIKRFAEEHEDFIPAAMAFDRETLTPKYVLQVGKVGDSQALWIAKKMAMSEALIQQAASYIAEKDYPKEKKNFSIVKKKATQFASQVEQSARYQKGDRVALTETKEKGLIYRDEGELVVEVFVGEEIKEVPRRRIQLEAKAQDLYPADYDLDSLFIDFHTRKKLKDIDRGSKKARKQLEKEAKERMKRNQE